MTTESVSFRITRSTEDLAQTIHALSHRLVRLEQRFAALELAVAGLDRQVPVSDEELGSLEAVERLLNDCRHLLAAEVTPLTSEQQPDELVA
ncbi:MAG: hypothetical protein VKM98_09510 [Cyanobacteriota bacterium]|nr:hypothetical protein [Cyanobacteriota bacterium]